MNTRSGHFVTFSRLGFRGRRWYFRYVAGNGETVFTSEAYNSAQGRDNGIMASRYCHDAPIREGAKQGV